ncbi:copper resistance CopC family protein [Corynebacterium sp. H78]|uniref:copper resistance CopC family protein n=1 Tax=Corynebacterium sp. H78 TaxID=3133417 RepID=UPI0030A8887D
MISANSAPWWRRIWANVAVAAVASAGVGIGVSGIGFVPVAEAHDSVVASNPADGGNVDQFPERIELTFSGEPRPNFNTLAISDTKTKKILFTGEPDLNGNVISLDVPDNITAADGSYMIGFQITSSDGHSTRGKTSFTVGDVQSGVEDGSNVQASSSSETSIPVWAYGLGGGLIVVVIAVIVGVTILNRKDN